MSRTPSPWVVVTPRDHGQAAPFYLVTAEDEHEYNDDFPVARCKGPDAESNARLISAAPDLLESLREFLNVFEEEIGSLDCTAGIEKAAKKAKAAIAKAEGRTE